MTVYQNEGNWGAWKHHGVAYNFNRNRREIHCADFDGDGEPAKVGFESD